jgi:ribosome maturation factor RimP
MAPTALHSLVRPLLAAAGLELWDVEVRAEVVRVLVDRPGGVDLDALTTASRVVSALLDAHDELAPRGGYDLEVSSPGLERTLRTPEHYRRCVGAQVSIKTVEPVGGARRLRGTLTAAGDEGCEITLSELPAQPVSLAYTRIERARTVLDWGPTPETERRPPAGRRSAQPARTRRAQPARTRRAQPARTRRAAPSETKDLLQ